MHKFVVLLALVCVLGIATASPAKNRRMNGLVYYQPNARLMRLQQFRMQPIKMQKLKVRSHKPRRLSRYEEGEEIEPLSESVPGVIPELEAENEIPEQTEVVELEPKAIEEDAVAFESSEDDEVHPKSMPLANPASSYFAINFGKTSGGSIAVANSYSTGKSGSATSHATSYGSGKQ